MQLSYDTGLNEPHTMLTDYQGSSTDADTTRARVGSRNLPQAAPHENARRSQPLRHTKPPDHIKSLPNQNQDYKESEELRSKGEGGKDVKLYIPSKCALSLFTTACAKLEATWRTVPTESLNVS